MLILCWEMCKFLAGCGQFGRDLPLWIRIHIWIQIRILDLDTVSIRTAQLLPASANANGR